MVWSQWRQFLAGGTLGCSLGVAVFLGGDRPALAIDPIPYDLDITFTANQNGTLNTGEIDGSFLLPCSLDDASALDCVIYDGTADTLEAGWELAESSRYVFKSLAFNPDISYSYLQAVDQSFTSAFYGYEFSFNNGEGQPSGRYFLYFFDLTSDFSIRLYLDGTGGAQGTSRLPEEGRDFNGFYVPPPGSGGSSSVCTNPTPPPSAVLCPPGGGVNFPITGFGNSTVTNAVPAPFSAILLVPAAALLRLRRRYRQP